MTSSRGQIASILSKSLTEKQFTEEVKGLEQTYANESRMPDIGAEMCVNILHIKFKTNVSSVLECVPLVSSGNVKSHYKKKTPSMP